MGATNSTLHYQLSQFISTDKPAWLQDYNGDMQKIDAGINGALTAADSAQNSADSAASGVSTLSDSVSALSTTVSGHTSDITDLAGDVNTIESLIGNGTPTAGDHTLIGAINTNTSDIAALKWKEGGHITTASQSLPTNFDELLIVINVNNSGVILTINIPKLFLSSTSREFRSGYFSSGSNGATVGFNVTSTTIALNQAILNGSDVTSNSTAILYYK